jgi:Acetyltransferase (GNAT) family
MLTENTPRTEGCSYLTVKRPQAVLLLLRARGATDHSLAMPASCQRQESFTKGRQGVGAALFDRVEAWAQLHGCRRLKVETQNTNARACRFCERQGCRQRAIHRAAGPELSHEIPLLWYKDLPR